MSALRRLALVLFLSLALLAGQQGAAWHALSHATEQAPEKQDPKAPQTNCDQCSLFAQLTGAVTASIPVVALLVGAFAAPAHAAQSFCARPRLAFHSRAPPSAS